VADPFFNRPVARAQGIECNLKTTISKEHEILRRFTRRGTEVELKNQCGAAQRGLGHWQCNEEASGQNRGARRSGPPRGWARESEQDLWKPRIGFTQRV